MDENIENRGKESDNSILDLDLNPDGVIRPFMFEPQHSSSSGEGEIFVDEETQRYTRRNIYALTSWKSWVVLLARGDCQEMPTEN